MNKLLLTIFFLSIVNCTFIIGQIHQEIVAEVDKSELHIYSKGRHGFGLAYENGHSVELWKNSFLNWLLDLYN